MAPIFRDRLYTYGPVYPVGIMDISTLSLARAQFVTSLSFLALFLSVALALAWILLFFKLRARMSGNGGWTAAYRFWVRIFALSFVLTLAASVPVLIQLGSLWAGLMDKIGNVAGPLLATASCRSSFSSPASWASCCSASAACPTAPIRWRC